MQDFKRIRKRLKRASWDLKVQMEKDAIPQRPNHSYEDGDFLHREFLHSQLHEILQDLAEINKVRFSMSQLFWLIENTHSADKTCRLDAGRSRGQCADL